MAEHRATISWKRESTGFDYDEYNRDHDWRFEGGIVVSASAAPEFKGSANCVDPEQALVASLSSCHMLTFLALASRKKLTIEEYTDEAVGFLRKNEEGKLAVVLTELHPQVRFASNVELSQEDFDRLHHQAHEACFIANSVKTEIVVKAVRL